MERRYFYRIIAFLTVISALSKVLICEAFKEKVCFEKSGHRGLGFKIVISCRCGRRDINCGPFIIIAYKIDRRIVFVMKLLGIAWEGINMFCDLKDIRKGLTRNSR